MLAKLTTKNQLTIPKKFMDQLPSVKYFDVELKEGAIVLKPLRVYGADEEGAIVLKPLRVHDTDEEGAIAPKPLDVYDTDLEQVRSKIRELGLKPSCVDQAIEWARSK